MPRSLVAASELGWFGVGGGGVGVDCWAADGQAASAVASVPASKKPHRCGKRMGMRSSLFLGFRRPQCLTVVPCVQLELHQHRMPVQCGRACCSASATDGNACDAPCRGKNVTSGGTRKARRCEPPPVPRPVRGRVRDGKRDQSPWRLRSAQRPGTGSRRNPARAAGSSHTAPSSTACRGTR